MQNKILLALILGFIVLCPQTALGDGIIVENASAVWNLTLDDATDVGHLVGEPGVMVTKYADAFSYSMLENATAIGRLFGEPGVIVTKYADVCVYYLLEDATEVEHLVGEPGVMVTKYADTFTYEGLTALPFDFTKPIISDVRVTSITLTSATVKWVTDRVADSLVKYGTESGNYTLQKYNPANVTSHSLNLIDLFPNTTYYFVVNCRALNGNSKESAEYNFSTNISEDNTAPYTSGHDPAKGAMDVPVGTNVAVHVLDDESEVDSSTIVMTVEGEVVTPTITGTPADYTLTYDPPVDFEYEQEVNVTIDASDVAGNPMNQDAYSFTTFSMGLQYFDTSKGTYPSIMGTHNGTITPTNNIIVNTLYTYSCPGTGGHTKYVRIYNATETLATGNGEGYQSADYRNITFPDPFTLIGGQTYNYTIRTGSYPQIIHAPSKEAAGGTITCTKFTDANGKIYNDWIPAIKLEYK